MRFETWVCDICDITIDDVYNGYVDIPKEKACPGCRSPMYRRRGAPVAIVQETDDPISAKPSSYWHNAEQCRLERERKAKEIGREKQYYNDPEIVKKKQIQKENQERMRQVNDDD